LIRAQKESRDARLLPLQAVALIRLDTFQLRLLADQFRLLPGGLGLGEQGRDQRDHETDAGGNAGGLERRSFRPLDQPLDAADRPSQDRSAFEEPLEILRKVSGAGVAIGDALAEALQTDGFQVTRATGNELGRSNRLPVANKG